MMSRSLPLWILPAALWVLRLVTAAMLAIDAYIHADLATRYDNNRHATLSQGDLFRIEAGVAAFAALLILVLATRVTWALAFVVAASALAAVQIYAHYDIGRIGPLPDMYEPLWYGEKARAAVAEAIATGAALAGFVLAVISVRARHGVLRRQRSAVDRVHGQVGGRAA
jgi:hypothetical protein